MVLWTATVIKIDVNNHKKHMLGKKNNSIRWLNSHSPGVVFSLRHKNWKGNSKLLFPADFYSQVTVYECKLYPNEKWLNILMPIHLTCTVSRHIWKSTATGCFHTWGSFLSWTTVLSVFLPYICKYIPLKNKNRTLILTQMQQ